MRSTLYPTTPSSFQESKCYWLPFIMTVTHKHMKNGSQGLFAVPKLMIREKFFTVKWKQSGCVSITLWMDCQDRLYFLTLALKSQRKATWDLLPIFFSLSHHCLNFPGEKTRKRTGHELRIVLKTVLKPWCNEGMCFFSCWWRQSRVTQSLASLADLATSSCHVGPASCLSNFLELLNLPDTLSVLLESACQSSAPHSGTLR